MSQRKEGDKNLADKKMAEEEWIDVHCHLNMLDVDPEEALRLAQEAGVKTVFTIGTQPEDHPIVLELAERFAPRVYCTLGVHPHDAKLYDAAGESFMVEKCSHPQVVAIGEIGLDYYYDHSDRETQKKVFRRQLEIAVEQNLPVQIHTRDAEPDTVAILQEFGGRVRGLVHCFTGSEWLAREALQLGLNISFSGVVTFKNAEALRQVCKMVPVERMHVETDAPFLTPVPFRGKKNHPAMVVHTAAVVAQLKGLSEQELAERTCANAHQLFTKLKA